MKNIKLVALVVATLISSLIAQAQTTTVDSTTAGKHKKTEVSSAKTTVKTTKAEIDSLDKAIKVKTTLIDLTKTQVASLDKDAKKPLQDSIKVWQNQLKSWNKQITNLNKRLKAEKVDVKKAQKGLERSMIADTTAKKSALTTPKANKDTTTTAATNIIPEKQPLQKQKPELTKGNGITKTITSSNTGTTTVASTDTATTAAARPQAEADFIKRNYGKYAYNTAIDITLAKDDSIGVQTFHNVKSRSAKVEDQWGVTVKHADGSITEYLVTGEDPTDALNAQLSTANSEAGNGTAKLSVHHGDGPDGKLSPSDLE